MGQVQPRLDADVAKLVTQAAKDNARTIPREVNRALKEYYESKKNQPKKP